MQGVCTRRGLEDCNIVPESCNVGALQEAHTQVQRHHVEELPDCIFGRECAYDESSLHGSTLSCDPCQLDNLSVSVCREIVAGFTADAGGSFDFTAYRLLNHVSHRIDPAW